MRFITYFDVLVVFIAFLILIGIITFLRSKKKKSLIYLILFTIFYVYIIKVLDYTLFQYQSLIILKYFLPGLILNGQTAVKSINLVPLLSLTHADLKTSFLNVLLFIPFGLGLPFITNVSIKKVIVIGALFSLGIEILQLITGLIAHITFRVADINDVIFNTIGAAIGCILYIVIKRSFTFPKFIL